MTDDNPPSPPPNPTPPLPPAGWYRDPMGQGDARYWNGVAWTESVSRGSVTFQVPVPADQLRVPPVPGSEYRAPMQPSRPQPAPQYAAPAPEPRQPEQKSSGATMLVGLAVAAAAILVIVFVVIAVFDDDGEDDPSTTTMPETAPAEVTDPPAQPEGTSGG